MPNTSMEDLREDILTSVLLSTQTKTIVCAFIYNHLEKEKEQIFDAFNKGLINANTLPDQTDGEDYYNETYKK